MKTLTKIFGALTLAGVGIYGGRRYEQYNATTEPFLIQKQGEAYLFIDRERERAVPATDIVPTYDKLKQIKGAVDEYRKKLQEGSRTLDQAVQ